MELRRLTCGWHLLFQSGVVSLIQIDFRLGLFLSDSQEMVTLHVETPCRLRGPSLDEFLEPAAAVTLSPALSLFNSKVLAIEIDSMGNLAVRFEGDRWLEVSPHASYEAWQVGSSTQEILLVCAPGGRVAFFEGGRREGLEQKFRTQAN